MSARSPIVANMAEFDAQCHEIKALMARLAARRPALSAALVPLAELHTLLCEHNRASAVVVTAAPAPAGKVGIHLEFAPRVLEIVDALRALEMEAA